MYVDGAFLHPWELGGGGGGAGGGHKQSGADAISREAQVGIIA